MKSLDLLAFDIGASNGRAILGRFDGNLIRLSELHRFENNYSEIDDTLYWDTTYLLNQLKIGFSNYKMQHGNSLSSFGIDTWGVDFGLLDESDNLINFPRAYRLATDVEMHSAWETVSQKSLFERTGIAAMNFNTIYQLHRRKSASDAELSKAKSLLLMPDLLAFFLTGEKLSEYTNVTTTNLYNPLTKDWDYKSISELDLPSHIFTPIDRAGQKRGRLRNAFSEELGLVTPFYSSVGTHDTASAVAAIPGKENFAFCSSGTWSLFGFESDKPYINDDIFLAGFSNEGTVQGGFRPLKNIMGLWLIQECRKEWAIQGKKLSWDEIVDAASKSESFRSIIDPDYPPFFKPGNMIDKVQKYCQITKQSIPSSVGQIARCIYESLALKYKWAILTLEKIKETKITSLNIVGGGSQNQFLNQLVSDAIGRPVIAGPTEGACIGNLLMQAVALGELSSIEDVRLVVANSFEPKIYEPFKNSIWDSMYERLLKNMETMKS